MKELLHILQQVPQFPALVQALETGQSPAAVSGLSRIHRAHFAAGLGTALDRPVVMVCADEDEAQALGRDITAFTGWSVTLIGSREFNFYNGGAQPPGRLLRHGPGGVQGHHRHGGGPVTAHPLP